VDRVGSHVGRSGATPKVEDARPARRPPRGPRAAAAGGEEAGKRAERVHAAMGALRSRQALAPEALLAMLEAAAGGPSGGVDDADVYAVCGW